MDDITLFSQVMNLNFIRHIRRTEVKDAFNRMKTHKVVGPNNIRIEVLKSMREISIMWLIEIFNRK